MGSNYSFALNQTFVLKDVGVVLFAVEQSFPSHVVKHLFSHSPTLFVSLRRLGVPTLISACPRSAWCAEVFSFVRLDTSQYLGSAKVPYQDIAAADRVA